MNELNESLNEYIESVKELDTNSKRQELYESLIDFGQTIQELAQDDDIQLHYLNNKEIDDLYNNNLSEDDFLEAMLVYVEMIKNMVGEYLLQK